MIFSTVDNGGGKEPSLSKPELSWVGKPIDDLRASSFGEANASLGLDFYGNKTK